MQLRPHIFEVSLNWRASAPDAESNRRVVSRAHEISAPGLEPIKGSSAKQFHGDADRWNPEQLLIASVAQCHMMTFLFLSQKAGLAVSAYEDNPAGTLSLDKDGIGGQMDQIVLKPIVFLPEKSRSTETDELVAKLHAETPRFCFIARSIHTPITVEATVEYM